MPSSDLRPQSDHRDIGLGVTFFKHSYYDRDDKQTYYFYTHLPTLGYCPGCSPKANLNVNSNAPSTFTSTGNLNDSFSSTTLGADQNCLSTAASSNSVADTEGELIDYPEEGVLVNAETHHSGPSYSYDDETIEESEEKRCEMVQFVLDQWAKRAAAKQVIKTKGQEMTAAMEQENRQTMQQADQEEAVAAVADSEHLADESYDDDANELQVVGDRKVNDRNTDKIDSSLEHPMAVGDIAAPWDHRLGPEPGTKPKYWGIVNLD